ncbi:MAG: hypothetical protein GY820_46665, partial [Gammaproteobacteria bacterium]|nr:hypothetical protein [Gammaproteobacteria bacterium]
MVIIISIYNNCQFNATKNILWVSKPSRWENNTVTVQERTDRIFVLNTNDMRDASSIKVIETLLGKGVAKIKAYDPLANKAA